MGTLGLFVDRQTLGDSKKLGSVMSFRDAAEALGHRSYFIFPVEMRKIAKTNALLIRSRTDPLNVTYVAARYAELHGIPVLDSSRSIRICSDKVNMYLHLQVAGVATPKTWYLEKGSYESAESLGSGVGFPVVLKEPSTSLSTRVKVVHDAEELAHTASAYLRMSHLVVAQEYVESQNDWRIGVLDGRVLFASRYVPLNLVEVVPTEEEEIPYYGVEVVREDDVPEVVLGLATEAAGAIGDGLYSVDIKQRDGEALVIEVNDNPSLEHGEERVYPDVFSSVISRLLGD
ncbi:MAG: ATP-grasp domain-containing protein [Methanomassiliicoccales archaeon]|nr:ATP-grasp domain-containing protein [Methanomassiliicoccales archaeon]